MLNNTSNEAPREEEKVTDYLISAGQLSLNEICGQDEAVKELQDLVKFIKYETIFSRWGVSAPRGYVLEGPPGVGKTESVRALAKELKDNVVIMELRHLDFASRWVDAPIENLRDFLATAEELSETKHVLIFIDEIESMIPSRQGQLHEATYRRVTVFLEWMQGGLNQIRNITVIGATNNIDNIDAAALRPGRFDKIIKYNNLTVEAIVKAIEVHLTSRKLSPDLIDKIDWNKVKSSMKSITLRGSDIPEILNRMLSEKALKQIDMLSLIDDEEDLDLDNFFSKVTTEDIIGAVNNYSRINDLDENRKQTIGFTNEL